jgi:WD40 repeat protein
MGVFFMLDKKIIFPILLWLFIIFTVSSGMCMIGNNNFAGLWLGTNIMFNVSEDGSKITATNSPFPDGGSLIVNLIGKNGKSMSKKITAEIPIRNGTIRYEQKYDNGTLTISGLIISDFAHGTASFNGSLYNYLNVLTFWFATPSPDDKPIVSPSRTFIGHTKSVSKIRLTPDLKRVVSGSHDKTINIWEMNSGNLLGTLKGHSKEVYCLDISPDGKRLISAGEDRKIIVWDLENYKQLNTIKDRDGVASLVFLADGQRFASGTDNGIIKIWDINTGETIRFSETHRGCVSSLLIAEEGRKLISAGVDNTIKIWNTEDGNLLNTLSGHSFPVNKIALSPDMKKLASVSFDNTVKVWDLATGQPLLTFTGHNLNVVAVAFTSDGKKVISGSCDNTIRIWDLETGSQLKMFHTLSGIACDIIVLPDGKQFMVGLGDGTIKFWDLESIMSEEISEN